MVAASVGRRIYFGDDSFVKMSSNAVALTF